MTLSFDDIIKLVSVVSSIAVPLLVAYTARQNDRIKAAAESNAAKLDDVATKTDGLATKLAEATRKEGFASGVQQEVDAAAATAVSDAKLQVIIDTAVAHALATFQAAQATPMDPGPRVARQLGDIKDVVDDVQPRVVVIEEATAGRDAAVERVATSADDRLTKLEENKEKP